MRNAYKLLLGDSFNIGTVFGTSYEVEDRNCFKIFKIKYNDNTVYSCACEGVEVIEEDQEDGYTIKPYKVIIDRI